MKEKIFRYIIPITLIISSIGFILLKTDILDEKYNNHVENLYKLTLIIGIIFILYKSSFIKEKLSLILKIFGLIFLTVLGVNLLIEFELIEINLPKFAPYFLFVTFLLVYVYFFIRKTDKTQLDYLKTTFISVLSFGIFINSAEFTF